jgi:hypothetical protein
VLFKYVVLSHRPLDWLLPKPARDDAGIDGSVILT